MRLRQVVLVAADLEAAVEALADAVGAGAPFHDPGVAVFGLRNAVLPVGDTFLEVVSPVRDDAPAARYARRHGGDGGYMVMVQSDDLAADRARVERLGVRVAWSVELDDIAGLHLHPADTGGALLSLDRPRPPTGWRWAGPGWEERSRRDVSRAVVAAELSAPEPGALARRWAAILGRRAEDAGDGAFVVGLERGGLRFVPGPAERLTGFDLESAVAGRAGESARVAGVTLRWTAPR